MCHGPIGEHRIVEGWTSTPLKNFRRPFKFLRVRRKDTTAMIMAQNLLKRVEHPNIPSSLVPGAGHSLTDFDVGLSQKVGFLLISQPQTDTLLSTIMESDSGVLEDYVPLKGAIHVSGQEGNSQPKKQSHVWLS